MRDIKLEQPHRHIESERAMGRSAFQAVVTAENSFRLKNE